MGGRMSPLFEYNKELQKDMKKLKKKKTKV